MRTRVRTAFTLVEILIVVVILGILAAIVIPQFTSASEDAQISAVQSQLQTVRNQIELFRVRNNGTPPTLANLFTNNGIVSNEYLRVAPVNPRTGTSNAIAGTAAPTTAVAAGGDAWVYDASNGNFWANGFDEANGAWY